MFFAGLLGTGAALYAAPQSDRRLAEITFAGIEIFRVRVNRLGNWVIARVRTSAGISGLGDASHSGRGDPSAAKLTECRLDDGPEHAPQWPGSMGGR
jgi:hypothetical protein